MIESGLEIGKFYIKRRRLTPRRPSNQDLVKIVGRINPGTFDHMVGYRYYSDRGVPYGPNGETRLYSVWLEERKLGTRSWNLRNKKWPSDLVAVATRADFADGFAEYLHVDLLTCTDVKRFVPHDFPNFRVILGGLYLNFMGMPILIDAIKHGEGDHLVFRSGSRSYNERGFYRQSERTMEDLAFQCVGNILKPHTVSGSFQ